MKNHPLVEKEIVRFLSEEKNPIRVVEVPLLFESKMDHYFDSIVVIDVDEKTQLERLNQRNQKTALYLKEINKTNKIDENKNKATYLIYNNGTLSDLEKVVKKSLNEVTDLIK